MNNGQIIGYIRVSTPEQNIARQVEALKNAGVEKLYIDKLSGKDTKRPQLQEMLNYIREGDTLIVESYSRLSRSLTDLLSIVQELNRKNVLFISLKENIDTSTPQGRLFMNITASLNEFEREIINERTREGVEIAKREGKYKGRKQIEKPGDFDQVVNKYLDGSISGVEAIRRLHITKPTFYRMLKRYGKKKDEKIPFQPNEKN